MHQSGKYSPTRYIAVVSPLAVALFHNSTAVQERNTNTADLKDSTRDPPTAEKELPNIKMRNSKARAVKAVSPKPQKREEKNDYQKRREDKKEAPSQTPVAPNKPAEDISAGGGGGAHHRPRKRSFRPPDVRTIFQPAKKRDPRVKEERGEGHAFEPDTPPAFCDVCCQTIFQERLTCTGESVGPGARQKW